MKFPTSAPAGYKSVFRKWWFWVGLLALIFGAWYLNGYFKWVGEQAGKNSENILAYTYWKVTQQQQAELEDAYKKDTYGGATPEETLKLFVQALEKKDYELASKYFVVEKQQEAVKENEKGEAGGANSYFIDAYQLGSKKFMKFSDNRTYEARITPPGEATGFIVEFKLNEFTNKWKILEL